jgi:hypothetical protein
LPCGGWLLNPIPMTSAKHRPLEIIDALLEAGATVCAFDPEAVNNVKNLLGDKINFSEAQYECLGRCRCPDCCYGVERIPYTGF